MEENGIRINKFLSEAGVCSRREADRQVELGNITIDGWLHWAPADAMMVVSDIGEQWSPHTAPAIHAEIEIII